MDKQIAENEGAFVELLNQEMKELQESQIQIEEMASYLIGKNVTGSDSTKVLSLGYLTVKEIASILVNAGYRKIPEGAVVLTREEIEIQGENYLNGIKYWQDMANKERKETAEKFAGRLKWLVAYRNCNEYYDWEDVQVDGQIFVECVNEVKKEVAEWNNG